ncbi:uncharacterized protein LOC115970209 [Quercus lobata]|uniref:uncharacterized protein LOC115970209 n=1 Tax=Quercus lobata TaxID=97700 RepID=UPI0012460176|nr:uncharacterized protein LOC115970209 [Quercus lobata]
MERMEYQGGDSGKPLTPDHFDTACSLEKRHVPKIGGLEDFLAFGHLFSNGKNKSHTCFCVHKEDTLSTNTDDLIAFWAPFLLVHLGGPDTITAFALEDNELWLRHFISFIVQLAVTVYVFLLTLPENKLFIPTLYVFGAGIIKYLERTLALYLASLGRLRDSMLGQPDPGPNYAKLMAEYSSKKEAGLPIHIELTPEPDKESKLAANMKEGPLTDLEVVTYAYRYFQIFKGLIADLTFSRRERNKSRNFFQSRTAEDALKVIDLELKFIYEAFYTKMVVVHSVAWYIFRFISILFVLVAFGFFYSLDKHAFVDIDVKVTYTLLYGAIFLDLIALIMLFFSDWTVASIHTNWATWLFGKWYLKIAKGYLKVKELRWSAVSESEKIEVLNTRRLLRRNLVNECSCGDPIPTKKLPKKLWEFIFDDLLEKSKDAVGDAETTKRIHSTRGAYAIQEGIFEVEEQHQKTIKRITEDYIENVAYDVTLLLWHVATELCFQETQKNAGHGDEKDGNWLRNVATKLICCLKPQGETVLEGASVGEYCVYSKLLSDYMIYLFVKQPDMMPAVAGIGKLRYRDTCAEIVNFFSRRGIKKKVRKKPVTPSLAWIQKLDLFMSREIEANLYCLMHVCWPKN